MGGLQPGAIKTVDQGHGNTAPGQGGGSTGAGNTGADNSDVLRYLDVRRSEPGRGLAALIRRRQANLTPEHFALASVAGCLAPGKAGSGQSAFDDSGTGKGGKSGAGARSCRQGAKQLGAPHLGVFGGRESIQKPGVDQSIKQGESLGGIAKMQIKGDALVEQ